MIKTKQATLYNYYIPEHHPLIIYLMKIFLLFHQDFVEKELIIDDKHFDNDILQVELKRDL